MIAAVCCRPPFQGEMHRMPSNFSTIPFEATYVETASTTSSMKLSLMLSINIDNESIFKDANVKLVKLIKYAV